MEPSETDKLVVTNLMMTAATLRALLAKGALTKAEVLAALTATGRPPSLDDAVIEACWNEVRAVIANMPGT